MDPRSEKYISVTSPQILCLTLINALFILKKFLKRLHVCQEKIQTDGGTACTMLLPLLMAFAYGISPDSVPEKEGKVRMRKI